MKPSGSISVLYNVMTHFVFLGYVPVDDDETTVAASDATDNLRLDDEDEFPPMS